MAGVASDSTRDPYFSLDIIDINSPFVHTDIREAGLVCSFHCPTVIIADVELEFSIRSEYPPSWVPDSTPEHPFSTSQNGRLLVVEFVDPEFHPGDGHIFVLFVHLSTILARIKSICDGQTGCIFPWEDWGPQDARMMDSDQCDFLYNIHGTKFVKRFPDRSGIELYDFNHRSIRHLLLSGEVDRQTKLLTEDTTCDEEGAMFKQPVTTSLPCLIKTFPSLTGTRVVPRVMLSEDALIVQYVCIYLLAVCILFLTSRNRGRMVQNL